jgi:TP901-1 family phage major tail protein
MVRRGYGAIFSLSTITTTTGILYPVAEITKVTAPAYTANMIDVTNQNTTHYFKEYVVGIRDAGSVSISANYISSSSIHSSIIPDAIVNGSKLHWCVSLGGTSSKYLWYGLGYITSYSITNPLDEVVTFDMNMKITGKPVGPADST